MTFSRKLLIPALVTLFAVAPALGTTVAYASPDRSGSHEVRDRGDKSGVDKSQDRTDKGDKGDQGDKGNSNHEGGNSGDNSTDR